MRIYTLLLHLYPVSFRNEYGEEMRALFARRRQQVSGPAALAGLWAGAIGEVIANAAAAHLDILKQDLAYTMRVLRRTPGFAMTAILIVALGIGATTAAFSVTDFVLLRPLPFPEPGRLVKVWEKMPGYARMELSPANYRDWKKAATSFESMGTYYGATITLLNKAEPIRLLGASVSADLFPTLGVGPFIGRSFSEKDDREGAEGALVLSYRLWQTEFGGDPNIVGQSLILESGPHTVIGVMPREFHFPTSDALFWRTNRFNESIYQDRGNNMMEAVGRLRRGVTLEQARAEMLVVAEQSKQQYPAENKNVSSALFTLSDEVSQRSRLLLVALSGAAACVLLIACANLANLLLARALGRRRELAVRTAIGAGRERLVRQLMTESLLLAGFGGALGIGVAILAVPLLAQLVPSTLPIAHSPSVDVRVLLVAAGLTVFTGIVFGLAPVMRAGGSPDLEGLREGSRSGGGQKEGLRSALVVAEIVASVVLLVSAGLLLRALWTIQGTDPGFSAEGVLTLSTPLPMPKYAQVAARDAFYSRVLEEVRALPGVTQAGYVSFLPMAFRGGIWPVSIDGRPTTRADWEVAALRYVTPGYFATLSIPVKRGRDVEDSDSRDRQFVAVVSESFARRYWPDQDPLGRHFTFALSDRVVVGVVGDVMFRGLERVSEPQVYLSSKQVNDGAITFYSPRQLAVKVSVDPACDRACGPRCRQEAGREVADLRCAAAHRYPRSRDGVKVGIPRCAFSARSRSSHSCWRRSASMAFCRSRCPQRAQEIGVRMALGAQSSDIFRWSCAAAYGSRSQAWSQVSRWLMRRGEAWRRCWRESNPRTRSRWRRRSVCRC